MRFKVGYVNSSAILAKIDTRRGLTHTVNASVLVYLQAPKVLYTQINWHPQWPKDLMVCIWCSKHKLSQIYVFGPR